MRIGPPELPAADIVAASSAAQEGSDHTTAAAAPAAAPAAAGGTQKPEDPERRSQNARKCIWMDKPLLRRELTLRERHERLYKHALLSLGVRAAGNASAAAFGGPLRADSSVIAAAPLQNHASSQPPHSSQPPSSSQPAHGGDAAAQSPAAASSLRQSAAAAAADEAGGNADGEIAADAGPSPPVQSPKRLTRAAARAASKAAGRNSTAPALDEPALAFGMPASQGTSQRPAGSGGVQQGSAVATAERAAAHPAASADEAAGSRAADSGAGTASRRDAGAATSAEGGASVQQPHNAVGTAQRGRSYDLWQLGRFRMMVRCHEAGQLQDPGSGAGLLLRAKMEYMPKQGMEAVRSFLVKFFLHQQ